MSHLAAIDSTIAVSQHAEQVSLSGQLYAIQDTGGLLSLAQVQQIDNWQHLKSSNPSFGITRNAVWLTFKLTGDSNTPIPLFFHLDFPVLDTVDVYILDNGELVNHFQAGEGLPFDARPIDYSGLIFPINAKQNVVTDVYVRVMNKGSMELPVSLWSQTAFLKNQLSILLIWGAMFSVFLVMTAYNGVLFYTTRDPMFGVFSLFCISIFAYFFTLRGFSFQYFWPNSSQWEIASPLVFIATSTALFNLLVYYFLQLSKSIKVGRFFLIMAALNAATILLLPIIEFASVMRLQIVFIITSATAAIIIGFVRWRKQNNQERLAFIGILSCACFAIYTTLGKLEVLNVSYLTDNGIAIAVTLTSLLFSFTLADRFRRLEKEKQDIKEESSAYLEQYRSLFESVSEGVFILNSQDELISANPSFCKMFNCESFEGVKHYIEREAQLLQLDGYQDFLKSVHDNKRVTNLTVELPVSKNKTIWVEVNSHHKSISDTEWTIEGTISDISERKANQTQLEYMANHDSLTHLLNRRAFEKELKSLVFKPEQTHALIYLDLDQFKVINDVYGHTVGDEFLRRLARQLKSELNNDQVLARLGGDEFGILSVNTEQQQAETLANLLLECVQNFSVQLTDAKLTVGASIGLVVFNREMNNIELLLSRADAACYLAKDLGRNRMHIYSAADDTFRQRQLDMSWVPVIKQAIENDDFQLYFQLIRPINGKEYGISYEILLRLNYQGEVVSPFDFLPAAERYGLMTQVDRWVITHFFQFLQAHPEHIKQLIKASINLSVQSISDPTFTEFLKQQFKTYQVPHKNICFEITETTAISNLDTTLSFINEYREKGCEFAIDDFGTGFSSFAYLKQLPADYLKIDGLFVKNILNSDVDRSMVASICEVADKLKIRTVAEFVESKAISDELMMLGVSYGQGYYFDRPSPIEELIHGKDILTQ
ncbi:MAG: EAL domain-containing protein [Gammaproteobacteria bacterium]|nr:EAL domain-containing protein [Gammaproteobacteria bacterium]